MTCNTFLQLKTRPILPRVVSQTSIVPFLGRGGPVPRECSGQIPSNCRRDLLGNRLPPFTPCRTPESSGVNLVAQQLPIGRNLYVFPPFVLIDPLLRFFIDQRFQHPFMMIVPDIQPRRHWWALLQATSVDRFSFLLLRLQVGSQDHCNGTSGLFVASVKCPHRRYC